METPIEKFRQAAEVLAKVDGIVAEAVKSCCRSCASPHDPQCAVLAVVTDGSWAGWHGRREGPFVGYIDWEVRGRWSQEEFLTAVVSTLSSFGLEATFPKSAGEAIQVTVPGRKVSKRARLTLTVEVEALEGLPERVIRRAVSNAVWSGDLNVDETGVQVAKVSFDSYEEVA